MTDRLHKFFRPTHASTCSDHKRRGESLQGVSLHCCCLSFQSDCALVCTIRYNIIFVPICCLLCGECFSFLSLVLSYCCGCPHSTIADTPATYKLSTIHHRSPSLFSFPASTSSVHQRGRLFKVCCLFCGSLNWQSWFVTAVLFIEQQPVLEFFLMPSKDPLQLVSNRAICPAVVRFGGNLWWYYLCSASLLSQQVGPCLND